MSIRVTGGIRGIRGTGGIGPQIACRLAKPGVAVFLDRATDHAAAARAARRGSNFWPARPPR